MVETKDFLKQYDLFQNLYGEASNQLLAERFDESLQTAQKAIELGEKIFGEGDGYRAEDASYVFYLSQAYFVAARACKNLGDEVMATMYIEKDIGIHLKLADLFESLNYYTDVRKYYNYAQALTMYFYGKESVKLVEMLQRKGRAELTMKCYAEAMKTLSVALEIGQKVRGKDHLLNVRTRCLMKIAGKKGRTEKD